MLPPDPPDELELAPSSLDVVVAVGGLDDVGGLVGGSLLDEELYVIESVGLTGVAKTFPVCSSSLLLFELLLLPLLLPLLFPLFPFDFLVKFDALVKIELVSTI